MNMEALNSMEWRALQKLAKENGVKANIKKTDMIAEIISKADATNNAVG